MALVAKERANSRTASRRDGQQQLSRTWVVYEDTGASQPTINEFIEAVSQLVGTAGAVYGREHPESPVNGIRFYATDVSTELVGESGRVCHVTWAYRPVSVTLGLLDAGDPGAVDFDEFTASHTFEFLDFYRAPHVLTDYEPLDTEPGVVGDSGSLKPGKPDIKGMPIDGGGIPGSVASLVATIDYTVNLAGSVIGANRSAWLGVIGRRSNSAVLGGVAGAALYLGHNIVRIDAGLYQVTHRFSIDEYSHRRQAAATDTEGNIATGPDPVTGGKVALRVYWVQPFPYTADFSILGI